MRELEEEFVGRGEVKGFLFKQLKFEDGVYLYQVTSESSLYYEVFERRGNSQYDCVSYPALKSFGVWAFTTVSLDKAYLRFEELKERVKER